MAGDTETGMMVMKMEKGLDTGPVALTAKVTIGENMTAGELHDSLMLTGARLMRQAMDKLEADDLPLVRKRKRAFYTRQNRQERDPYRFFKAGAGCA